MLDGTPRALLPITEQVIVWVESQRRGAEMRRPTPDELRRIELCALAARDIALFNDLYGGEPNASAPQVQDERRAPGGLPAAEVGCCGCTDCGC